MAAMLWDCEFRLKSGRRFTPLARAPWADQIGVDASLPAHMRLLGGEFVCLPFGIGGMPADLSPEWRSDAWGNVNRTPHGHSADGTWGLVSSDPSQVELQLQYPQDEDVESVTRRVKVVPDAPALDFELIVKARRCTRQPIGLHPILRLPEWPSQLAIEASFDFGVTYPALVPPGASRVAAGRRFACLSSIDGIRSGSVDYSRLPKQTPTEEMLMLCKVHGPLTVRYMDENACLRLTWDTNVLPSCLLWPSDRALADPPWNQSFRGLGIEPIAAVFDAAREVALERNPINASGVATAVELDPNRPLTIRYRIAADDF